MIYVIYSCVACFYLAHLPLMPAGSHGVCAVCSVHLTFCVQGVSKKIVPKTFWNIFTLVRSFCVKFCKFVGTSKTF